MQSKTSVLQCFGWVDAVVVIGSEWGCELGSPYETLCTGRYGLTHKQLLPREFERIINDPRKFTNILHIFSRT